MAEHLKLFIDIETGAFPESPTRELARILRNYADNLETAAVDPAYTTLLDSNGNKVGEVQISTNPNINGD